MCGTRHTGAVLGSVPSGRPGDERLHRRRLPSAAGLGTLRITSADPYAPPPLIHPATSPARGTYGWYSRVLRRLVGSPAPRRSPTGASRRSARGSTPWTSSRPALVPAHTSVRTARTAPVGACALGEDGTSVAESVPRVPGLDGPRVADASVIPSIPADSTDATVHTIAGRAADLPCRI
ncbi:GMC oxidoreductase [Streptomyces sp. NPDC007088]|uniref:GMC oxidoreductase n=1 Tax=Streptomyces sp. NPDC007088 TaxID=3364773 RepID=UPI0036CC4714